MSHQNEDNLLQQNLQPPTLAPCRSQAQSRPEAGCRYQWLQARKVLSLLRLCQHNRGQPQEEWSLGDKQEEPGTGLHAGCLSGGVQALLHSLLC